VADDNRNEPTRRQIAKKERRDAGDRSSEVARTLMTLSQGIVDKLGLDEDLADVVAVARKVTSPVARRRAERALAGELRRIDLADVVKRIASVQERGVPSQRLFHMAEKWRNRMLEEDGAAAEFLGGPDVELSVLVAQARREKESGKPPGAGRKLFRYIMATLEERARAEAADQE
jgi:ribosome-associated protein